MCEVGGIRKFVNVKMIVGRVHFLEGLNGFFSLYIIKHVYLNERSCVGVYSLGVNV